MFAMSILQLSKPGKVVKRFLFCKLLNEAWAQSMSSSNITAGFNSDRIAISVKMKDTTNSIQKN